MLTGGPMTMLWEADVEHDEAGDAHRVLIR